MVKLPNGNARRENPFLAAIARNRYAAVVAVDEQIGILWVNPKRVVVGVGLVEISHGLEAFAAVDADVHRLPKGVQLVFVDRVGDDVVEIKRAVGNNVGVVGHQRPVEAAVGTGVKSIFLGLDHRVHPVGVGGRNRHAAATVIALGQPFGLAQLFPAFTAVEGQIQP